ncbi:MAG: hypothetical protein ACLP59_01190 [Bryobacteraceae bacterium]
MAQSSFLEKDSPVDFLYLDKQRISSLIGQLSDRGVLTGYKSVVAKSQAKEGTAGGTALVAKAEGKLSRTSSESAEETYDPFWAHVYTFLQDLEANFAVPLGKARMGSLVKFSALIQFLDLRIMRNLWEPSARIFLQSQKQTQSAPNLSRKVRREQQRQQPQPEVSDAVKIGLEVLKEVPHLLHMTFITKSDESLFRLWAAVQPGYLTINTEDLVMKYGAVIDGLWTVVGIVDARIGDPPEPWKINPVLDGVVTAMGGLRELIGRPKDNWGLIPIAIYSPLQGAAEADAGESAGTETRTTDSAPLDQGDATTT